MDDYEDGFDSEGVIEFIEAMFPKIDHFKCDSIDDEGFCGHVMASAYPPEERSCLLARDLAKTCKHRRISEINLNA